jgi:hypothetical protein
MSNQISGDDVCIGFEAQHLVIWAPSRPRMRRSICSILDVAHDTPGPNRTLAVPYNAGVQLSHCRHSCMAQHFCRLKRRCADQAVIERRASVEPKLTVSFVAKKALDQIQNKRSLSDPTRISGA